MKVSAAVGATVFTAPAMIRARSLNEKLAVAVIGPCRQGKYQLEAARTMEKVAAICDVDSDNLAELGNKYPEAKTYVDFRQMLADMDDSIDAVMVSTPDHTHAVISALAMRKGKHCYCEKPLTHTIHEARMLTRLAKEKNNLVTQMGIQIHAEDNYRRVVELIQAGAIGQVGEVYAWVPARYGNPQKRPAETFDMPKNLDWNLWLGPVPFCPYHPCYMQGGWRGWWDFGAGVFGDFACHLMDLVFWALDLRHPTSVEAFADAPADPDGCRDNLTVRYEFAARGNLPPVTLTWYDGDKTQEPNIPPHPEITSNSKGVLFIGSEGMLLANYEKHALFPTEKFKDYKAPEPTIPKSIGHHKEFFEACKTGGPTTCNFDYSGTLTESVLLGTVAYRVGKKLDWDPENLKARNCPEADQYLSRPYREGWTL